MRGVIEVRIPRRQQPTMHKIVFRQLNHGATSALDESEIVSQAPPAPASHQAPESETKQIYEVLRITCQNCQQSA